MIVADFRFYAFQFGFCSLYASANVVPKVELNHLTNIKYHQSLAIAQADIDGIFDVEFVVEGVYRTIHSAISFCEFVSSAYRVFYRIGVVQSVNIVEVCAQHKGIEFIGKSRLHIVAIAPHLVVGVKVNCVARACPILSRAIETLNPASFPIHHLHVGAVEAFGENIDVDKRLNFSFS